MSNPRLEELEYDIEVALAGYYHSVETPREALKQYKLLLELEFLKRLANEPLA